MHNKTRHNACDKNTARLNTITEKSTVQQTHSKTKQMPMIFK